MRHSVSVVMPVYECEKESLEKSIRSVLGQTFENFELIIVDDGSKVPFSRVDQNKELMDPRIDWVVLDGNRGVAGARNAGAKQACGDYLAFLDAGDWWDRNKLEMQVQAINCNTGCALVYCSAVFHKGNCERRRIARVSKNAYRELLVRQPITGSASSVMMLRSVFEKTGGFYEEIDIPEDRDLWLRIARDHPICFVEAALVHIQIIQNSRSADPQKKSISYFRLLERYRDEIVTEGVWTDAMAHYHLVLAKKYLAIRQYRRACARVIVAIVVGPGFVWRAISNKAHFKNMSK